jgi:arylsulfatase A-like enzyme
MGVACRSPVESPVATLRPDPEGPARAGTAADAFTPTGVRLRSDSGETRPNIVWIVLDALRAGNLSCYGYERQTSPHLDALAARGVLFEQNYAQANFTRFSTASYMTGRFFPVHSLYSTNWRFVFRTPPEGEKLFSETLRENGYHAVAVTSHPYIAPGTRFWESFDHVDWVPPTSDDEVYADLRDLNEVVFRQLESLRDHPFFLYVHALDTHFPHDLRSPYDRWLDPNVPQPIEPPYTLGEQEYLRGLHDGSALLADEEVGKLLTRLAESGLGENTIIVVTSDHGDLLGEDGETLEHPSWVTTDELFHVPLIVAGPGLPPGRRVSGLTQSADIVPTLHELLRLDGEATYDGKTLLPLIRGTRAASPHRYVFGRGTTPADDGMPLLVLRGERYRYELDPGNGTERLWAAPDRLGHRRDVLSQAPEVAEEMRSYLEERILPLWKRYERLPRSSPRLFVVGMPGRAEPREAYVVSGLEDSSSRDDKWTLGTTSIRSFADQEDAPPLRLVLEVPHGTYDVDIEVPSGFRAGRLGSAVLVRAEDETLFRKVIADAPDTVTSRYVGLGRYVIGDGRFEVELDEADREHLAAVKSFRFRPPGASAAHESDAERSRQEQQLRALGYIQ